MKLIEGLILTLISYIILCQICCWFIIIKNEKDDFLKIILLSFLSYDAQFQFFYDNSILSYVFVTFNKILFHDNSNLKNYFFLILSFLKKWMVF